MKVKPHRFMVFSLFLLVTWFMINTHLYAEMTEATIDPHSIPKFVNQLPILPKWEPYVEKDSKTGKILFHKYWIAGTEFKQQILPPGFPQTTVWGYAGLARYPGMFTRFYFQNSPGATFEATRHIPVKVNWINRLTGRHIFPVDPTIHWANPNDMPMPMPPFLPYPPGYPQAQNPVTFVTHLHGGEDRSDSDGHPEAWITADGKKGPAWVTDTYLYPNDQNPTTLWYHDHSLGITRLNIQAGLLGMYIIRDPGNPLEAKNSVLPSGKYEIAMTLQDHTFNKDGSFFFPSEGDNPDIHPYWNPEFFGNVITVNGKAWPNLNVERRQYRFRIVNGSNARFYNLSLSNGMSFTQIGSDGGYLPQPVQLTSALLGIAERFDILIDFSNIAPGTKIVLRNDAPAPFPSGDEPIDPATTGLVMQFTVTNSAPVAPLPLPAVLNKLTALTPDTPRRVLVLFEVESDADEPLIILLDGQRWFNMTTETPRVGSTQDWEIINLTDDAHPIHLHLIQFQILNRQQIDRERYTADWIALNGQPPLTKPTVPLAPEPYLIGNPVPPDPNESGWKDTVKVYPDSIPSGAITRIRVRIAPQDAKPENVVPGVNPYPFDPTFGPGYVWHCHILDHEDNEMMRPFIMIK